MVIPTVPSGVRGWPDSEATSVEINFLQYVSDAYWDFPKNEDVKIVELKFVFYGPANPLLTSNM